MSTQELQLFLIEKILHTVDEDILKLLKETLSKPKKTKKKISINDPKHPFYDKLSTEEEKNVLESLAEHKAGKGTVLSTFEEMENYFDNLV